MNMRVKGTVLIDFAKTVKADKTGACAKYLTDADREIISSRLLPSGWYPFETFKNCFTAAFETLAKSDLERVRQWGKLYGENIIKTTYKGMVKQGDPKSTLAKYGAHIRNFFDSGDIEVEEKADKEAILTVRGFDRNFAPIYYIMAGWVERSMEMSGAKHIKSSFLEKSWEGAANTRFQITWEYK